MTKRANVQLIPATAAIETILNIISMIVNLLDAIYSLIIKIFSNDTTL